jgi:hypothetical protein
MRVAASNVTPLLDVCNGTSSGTSVGDAVLPPPNKSDMCATTLIHTDLSSSVPTLSSDPIAYDCRSATRNETSSSDRGRVRRFVCPEPGCERRCTSQYTLRVHMGTHKPKSPVNFPCTFDCSERFSRRHDRLRHEVTRHGKVCEFVCPDCERFFSLQKTLRLHKCPMTPSKTRWVK